MEGVEDFPQGWRNLIRQSPLGQVLLNEKSPWYPPHITGIHLTQGGIFMIFGDEILLDCVRLGKAILYLYWKKKSLQWKNPWRPRLGETDSFSTDYLRWSEIIYLMMLKNYNFIHCFSFMYEFLNKVYESSAAAFIIRMISDRFRTRKRSENILTWLFFNKRNGCVIAIFRSQLRW